MRNKKTMRMKSALKSIVRRFLKILFFPFPITKGKIVLDNFGGKGYGDNPKYLADEIIRQNLPFKIVWMLRQEYSVPNNLTIVSFPSVRAFYELATAEIVVDNCKNVLTTLFIKKKKQLYLQTWHGDFPLKYIEREVENSLSPAYVKTSKADSIRTNAIISGNTFFSKILQNSFWLPDTCEILEYGVPRNDVYFRDEKYRAELKKKYHFGMMDKILLYAPTFRDNGDTSCYDLDFEKIRQTLSSMTNEKWKIVIRLHPNVAKQADLFEYNETIINGSIFPDPQELCFISDCLITDYSSIMSDFMLMQKPVFLYCPDLEKYADKSQGRGLRDIFWKLPFSMGKSQDELLQQISSFDNKNYLGKLVEFMQKEYVSFDDGHASEKIVNYIKEKVTK